MVEALTTFQACSASAAAKACLGGTFGAAMVRRQVQALDCLNLKIL
jgi:hypothetical protein